MKLRFPVLMIALLCALACRAGELLELPSVLSDHMVLQQKDKVLIWGRYRPNASLCIETSWGARAKVCSGEDGEWSVRIKTPEAGFTPHRIVFRDEAATVLRELRDVLIGEVWLCAGQSNMEMPMRGFGSVEKGNYQPVCNAEEELKDANIPSFRYFKVNQQISSTVPCFDTAGGEWAVSDSVSAREFEAIAFFFGRQLVRERNVPVGIIGCAYGGTRIESWMSPESICKFKEGQYKTAAMLGDVNHKSAPSNLYRGMFSPVKRYRVKGVLWYQGESNRDNACVYSELLEEMVSSWRREMQQQFPFFYVQIAPFKSADTLSAARLREAQWMALKRIPDAKMVCVSDAGSLKTIHYPDKQVPAKRLFDVVNRYVYRSGKKAAATDYPSMSAVTFKEGIAVVKIANGKGLYASADVDYAEVAGADRVFVKAEVVVGKDRIYISSKQVANPVAVRYCFRSWHVGQIFNEQKLPLLPFRSDDW